MFVWPPLFVLEATTVRLKTIVLLCCLGGFCWIEGEEKERERERERDRELENFTRIVV